MRITSSASAAIFAAHLKVSADGMKSKSWWRSFWKVIHYYQVDEG